jgi:hypothetical protein
MCTHGGLAPNPYPPNPPYQEALAPSPDKGRAGEGLDRMVGAKKNFALIS